MEQKTIEFPRQQKSNTGKYLIDQTQYENTEQEKKN